VTIHEQTPLLNCALNIPVGLTSQAERIAKLVITGPARRNYAADRSKVVFQLDKICRDLQINLDGVENEKEIMDLVISHLNECMKDTRTRSMLLNSPKILKNLTEDSVLNLSEQRKEIVDRIVITLFEVIPFLQMIMRASRR
jgi:hypothetical protein